MLTLLIAAALVALALISLALLHSHAADRHHARTEQATQAIASARHTVRSLQHELATCRTGQPDPQALRRYQTLQADLQLAQHRLQTAEAAARQLLLA